MTDGLQARGLRPRQKRKSDSTRPTTRSTVEASELNVDTNGIMELPFTAKAGIIVGVFLAEVLILHFFLIAVPQLRLKKTGWAVVQYIVIAFALLGLLGAVTNTRQMIAQNLFDASQPHLEFEFRDLLNRVDLYSSSGIVCRTFERGNFSPPPNQFSKTQREYNDVCEWFKKIASSIPRELPAGNADILWQSLPAEPKFSDPQLIGTVQLFRQTLDDYNRAAKERRDLQKAAHRSDLDSSVIFFTPLFLSLALALQTTKTTYDAWWKRS